MRVGRPHRGCGASLRWALAGLLGLFAVPAVLAQEVQGDDLDHRCVFRFRSPPILFVDGGAMQLTQEVEYVGARDRWVGSHDARVRLPACDRERWHCIAWPGVPLYLPKPFSDGQRTWSHDGHHYHLAEPMWARERGGQLLRPLLVSRAAQDGSAQALVAIYLFDAAMNLVGYAHGLGARDVTAAGTDLPMAWLDEATAPLDCY